MPPPPPGPAILAPVRSGCGPCWGIDILTGLSASTSDGKVSVAAAVAVNIADSQALATIPAGLTIASTGELDLIASNTTSATATASGNATGTAQVGVGAAVALNLVNASTGATIQASSGQPTTINTQGVILLAGIYWAITSQAEVTVPVE